MLKSLLGREHTSVPLSLLQQVKTFPKDFIKICKFTKKPSKIFKNPLDFRVQGRTAAARQAPMPVDTDQVASPRLAENSHATAAPHSAKNAIVAALRGRGTSWATSSTLCTQCMFDIYVWVFLILLLSLSLVYVNNFRLYY